MGTALTTMTRVRLIAAREIVVRLSGKAFWLVAAGSAGFIVLFAALPSLASSISPDHFKVDVVGEASAQVAVRAQALVVGSPDSLVIRRTASDAAARSDVLSGRAAAALLADGASVETTRTLNPSLRVILTAGEQEDRARDLKVTALRPNGLSPNLASLIFGAMTVVLFESLNYAGWIGAGIMEEKTSRTAEVLLTKVSPRDILIGKVAGIGFCAALNTVVVLVLASVVAVATGSLKKAGTGSTSLTHADAVAFLQVVPWAVVSLVLLASLMGLVSAGISKLETLATAQTPILGILIGAVAGGSIAQANPGSTATAVLSFIPPTSLMAMPIRAATHHASTGASVASMLLTLSIAAASVPLSSRLYRRSLLGGALTSGGSSSRRLTAGSLTEQSA